MDVDLLVSYRSLLGELAIVSASIFSG